MSAARERASGRVGSRKISSADRSIDRRRGRSRESIPQHNTNSDVNLQLISVDIVGGVKYAWPTLPARAVSPGGKGGSTMTSNLYLSSGGVRTCTLESSTSSKNTSRTNKFPFS